MLRMPVFEFDGCETARMMNRVCAENLIDLVNKVEKGCDNYPKGFMHTSTMPHEGTCYYRFNWTRDAGRGMIELARMGRLDEAREAVGFFIAHKNKGDHWGRLAAQDKSLHTNTSQDSCGYETDGNALVLLAFYNVWKYGGKEAETAREMVEGSKSVVAWFEKLMDACPYGDLIPSISELSGNPTFTAEQVYGIYPNFHAYLALLGLKEIAESIHDASLSGKCREMAERLHVSLKNCLVAGGIKDEKNRKLTSVDEGCWINGISSVNGLPFEHATWGLTSFPVWHWTRQLPFIGCSDLGFYQLPKDDLADIHARSYSFLLKYMNQGYYFRKYGFVSNTGWSGTGGSHDDTMCGYGQGFFTQASLMMDDVNTYSKCIDGMMKLAYDGNVTENLSFEMNPWLLHECFDYENYEQGHDHTYGCRANGVNVYENPGDEGSLVQQAEPVKAMLLMAGVTTDAKGRLTLMPRMPWNFDVMNVTDMPYCGEKGIAYVSMRLRHLRHLRKMTICIESSEIMRDASFRAGPFPSYTRPVDADLDVSVYKGAAWFTKKGINGMTYAFEVQLRQEIEF